MNLHVRFYTCTHSCNKECELSFIGEKYLLRYYRFKGCIPPCTGMDDEVWKVKGNVEFDEHWVCML